MLAVTIRLFWMKQSFDAFQVLSPCNSVLSRSCPQCNITALWIYLLESNNTANHEDSGARFNSPLLFLCNQSSHRAISLTFYFIFFHSLIMMYSLKFFIQEYLANKFFGLHEVFLLPSCQFQATISFLCNFAFWFFPKLFSL